MNSCYRCSHLLREEESWEMPHIWWWNCRYKESMANLSSFPFRNTKCQGFKPLDNAQGRSTMQLLDPNPSKE